MVEYRNCVLSAFCAVVLAGATAVSGQIKQDNQIKPDVPRGAADPSPSAPASKIPESVGAAVDPNKYTLGSEDVLYIQVWREPDFSGLRSIRPDGKITLPLVGDIPAADKTPLQLTADLKERLGKYINNPDVTVSVQEVRSKKYYIDGEVLKPGAYALITPTNVLEALSMAGGFKEFSNVKKIKVLRAGKTLKFNYKEVTKGKNLDQNILLENGDHVIVP